MNEGFSGVVRISDVDDFIAPSQDCIIPLIGRDSPSKRDDRRVVSIADGQINEFNEKFQPLVNIKKREKNRSTEKDKKSEQKAVQISLNDCLACSGCITTAEAVLIEQQSAVQLMSQLAADRLLNEKQRRTFIVTISPQSLASIAAKRALPLQKIAEKIVHFFVDNGVSHVLDSSFSRNFSLLATFHEFKETFAVFNRSPDDNFFINTPFPILSSSCPGWICYAEKTHGPLLVPHLSKVRSPQAISGALVKHFIAKKLGQNPRLIYHASVMPCFDKKLEASRSDFLVPGTDVKEVDCVISTVELNNLLEEWDKCGDTDHQLSDLGRGSDQLVPSISQGLIGHRGGPSGGYCEYVLYRAIRDIFHLSPDQVAIECLKRNKDFEEITVRDGDNLLLRVGKAYGFRNIQNIVQKLKRDKLQFHFVEVMACPAGCTNGGGQIRVDRHSGREEQLVQVNELYQSVPTVDPETFERANVLFNEWIGQMDSESARNMLFTNYHSVTENIANKRPTIKW